MHAPARFYSAQIRYDSAGLHDVQLTGMRTLRSPDQQPYVASNAPDPEALRIAPGGRTLLWSSEGNFARGIGPELSESNLDGQWLHAWPLPEPLQLPKNGRRHWGPRSDATLEGMSFSEDGNTLWLAMEGALQQDGPMPGPGHAGGPVRITAIDAHTRQARQQLAYQADALPDDIWLMPQRALNGVSDVLADGPDHLLVLERSFAVPLRFGARLYRIRTRINDADDEADDHADDDADPFAASDTLRLPELKAGSFRVARKELLVDFSELGLRSVDNLEGMTWGPRLASGERVLLLVSDNNFNPAQVTQFVALVESTACNTE